MYNPRGNDGGDDPRYTDGKGAHGSLYFSHFHGACGAYGVGSGTDGDTLCYFIMNPENAADKRGDNGSCNSGHDNGNNSDGRDASDFLGKFYSHGCGDGFGHKGNPQRFTEIREGGKQDNAENGDETPCSDSRENRYNILAKVGKLLV